MGISEDMTLDMLRVKMAAYLSLPDTLVQLEPIPFSEVVWCTRHTRLHLRLGQPAQPLGGRLSFVQQLAVMRAQRLLRDAQHSASHQRREPLFLNLACSPLRGEAAPNGRRDMPQQVQESVPNTPGAPSVPQGPPSAPQVVHAQPGSPHVADEHPQGNEDTRAIPHDGARSSSMSPSFYRDHCRVVLRCQPRGRKDYPVWPLRSEQIRWLHFEFARISRRAAGSFHFRQSGLRLQLDTLCGALKANELVAVHNGAAPPDLYGGAKGDGRGHSQQQAQHDDDSSTLLPHQYQEALHRCRALPRSMMMFSQLQLKAMLRSAPGFAKRVASTQDDNSLMQVLGSQAKRLGLHPQSAQAESRGRSSSPGSIPRKSERSASKSVRFSPDAPTSQTSGMRASSRPRSPLRWGWPRLDAHQPPKDEWQLIEGDWTLKPVNVFKAGESGVWFAPCFDDAEKALPTIRSSGTHFVVLTYKALCDESEEQMFRIKRPQDTTSEARVLQGFATVLNGVSKGLSEQPKAFVFEQSAATKVVGVDIFKQFAGDDWSTVKKGETPGVRTYISKIAKQCELQCMDVFKIAVTGDSLRCLLRVRAGDLKKWMVLSPSSGVSIKPLGSDATEFGLVWQRGAEPVTQHDAYKDRRGYAGIVIKPDSVGIRMEVGALDSLKETLGVAGQSWTVTGLPPGLDSDQLCQVLKSSGWEIEAATSRRVLKGRAQWKVRAKGIPPLAIMAVQFEKETYNVGITRSSTQNSTSAAMRSTASSTRTRSSSATPVRGVSSSPPEGARGESGPRTSPGPLPPKLPLHSTTPVPAAREDMEVEATAEKKRKAESPVPVAVPVPPAVDLETRMEARIMKLESQVTELSAMPSQMATLTKSISELAVLVHGLSSHASCPSTGSTSPAAPLALPPAEVADTDMHDGKGAEASDKTPDSEL